MSKREIINRQKRRKRRQMMVRNIFRVVLPLVLVSLGICLLIWKFVLSDDENITDFTPDTAEEAVAGEAEGEGADADAGAEDASAEEVVPEHAIRVPVKSWENTARTTDLIPGWHDDGAGRWYQNPDRSYYADGFAEIDGVQYFFDEEGHIVTGWVSIGDKDYYFDQNGSFNRDRKRPMLAVTFNGGPSEYTEELLDILEECGSRATFFVKGEKVEGYADTVRRMTEIGCEAGSNSWDDLQLNLITLDELTQKFGDTDDALLAACGKTAAVARAPYAMANDDIYRIVGKPFFTWSLDTEDGEKMDASSIYDTVMDADLMDGDIILLHDIYGPTVEAARKFIPELVEKGFKLVTVSEMASAKEVELRDTVYSNFLQSSLDTGTVPGYIHNEEITARKLMTGE